MVYLVFEWLCTHHALVIWKISVHCVMLILSPKCQNISLYNIKKKNKTLNIIRKVLSLSGCKLMVADTSFQNSNLYLKAWILSLATKKINCFPKNGEQITLFIFDKMSKECPSMNSLSVILSSKMGIPWKGLDQLNLKKMSKLLYNYLKYFLNAKYSPDFVNWDYEIVSSM